MGPSETESLGAGPRPTLTQKVTAGLKALAALPQGWG